MSMSTQQQHDYHRTQQRIHRKRQLELDQSTGTSYGTHLIVFGVLWQVALACAVAHALQRLNIPELPYGLPLLAGLMVVSLGALITSRFKFSWMGLSLTAAALAAAYL
jgi:uncharacterized membrane protein